MYLLNDRLRRAAWCEYTEPVGRFKARHARFGHRRQVWHGARTRLAGDGERFDATAFDLRHAAHHANQGDGHFAGDYRAEGGGAFVRHMRELCAGDAAEPFHRQMCERAVARCAVVERAGF